MKTPDLRQIAGRTRPLIVDADSQEIIIKRWTWETLAEYHYYLATPDRPEMTRVYIDKSLHYASHSTHLGITGPALLQLSLALCLRLYPVSRAITFHKEFAGRFLIDLPTGKFYHTLTVPL